MKKFWISMIVVLLGAALLSACGGTVVETVVVEKEGDYELRQYSPQIVAETYVTGDFDEVGNEAFRRLFKYISGENKSKASIAMTAPVTQRPKGGADANTYVLSFVMPSGYTLDTLPEPPNPQVRLREEPAKLMAVRGYSGRWTQANYREHEAQLLAAVERAGLTHYGPPVYARYNSPFSLWFLRRNEVMVEVEASQ